MKKLRVVPTLAAALVLAAAGCGGGGPKFVPVSGVVTVNGEPYANAVVSFQPIGTPENPHPGQGSSALTDAQGKFTLVGIDGSNGAVVGKHRVRIQTKRDDPTAYFDPAVGTPDDPSALQKTKKRLVDPIPTDWYSDKSDKTFDVPPGGTDKANFDIQSLVKTKPAGK